MLKKCFFHVNEHNEALCWWGSVCDSHTVAVELSHSSFTRCLLLVFPICGHSGQICEFVSDDYHSFWLMWASSSGFMPFMVKRAHSVHQFVVNYWNRAVWWIACSDFTQIENSGTVLDSDLTQLCDSGSGPPSCSLRNYSLMQRSLILRSSMCESQREADSGPHLALTRPTSGPTAHILPWCSRVICSQVWL